jgi:hypothetical protein
MDELRTWNANGAKEETLEAIKNLHKEELNIIFDEIEKTAKSGLNYVNIEIKPTGNPLETKLGSLTLVLRSLGFTIRNGNDFVDFFERKSKLGENTLQIQW